jgi:hypothetical protein
MLANVRALSTAILGVSLLWSGMGRAQERSGCDEARLREEAHRARVWRYAWTGVNGALMVGSFVAVPLVPSEERPDYIIGGIGSAVNTATSFFMPLRVESAEAELDEMPASERPKHVRRLVLESAEDERARVTWPWHALNVGMAIIPGAIIAFGYGHYTSGLTTTLVGTALGEVQLFTQPTGLPLSCEASGFRLVPRFQLLGETRAPSGGLLTLTGAF